MVSPITPPVASPESSVRASARMLAVTDMAKLLRRIFEVEREFLRTATTLIYRVGEPELKYLISQHTWESAQHARFLKERGREMTGFGAGEGVRDAIRKLFEEAASPRDGSIALAGFYRVIKPALLEAYRHYLRMTDHLADWPTKQLLQEFIVDEERHGEEIRKYLRGDNECSWCDHLRAAAASIGGLLGQEAATDFDWKHPEAPYAHPATCERGRYPVASSVFGHDPEADPIVREWLVDPATDARVLRVMVYVWLMNEMDAVDYLATVFYDTPQAPLEMHYDMARHLWDESRHSQFGFRQLPKLGIDIMSVEHALDLFTILVQMPPAERYAMMTMEFEAGSFPTKAIVMDRIRELNDFEADTLLAFDRNDEQNHVRYGHRWLGELMKLFEIETDVGEFVTATRAKFAESAKLYGGKTPHTLPREKRLTGNKILKKYGLTV